MSGSGTAEDPWVLQTPPGSSTYTLHRDDEADPPALVCTVGTTVLRYDARCIDHLHAMLLERGDWVELGSADKVRAYRQYLENYSNQQRAAGRFERPTNVRLHSVMEWLDERNAVPGDVRLQMWLAFGFLAVCLLNTVGLLLAKFMRRSSEIGVRRALGASRLDMLRKVGLPRSMPFEQLTTGVPGFSFKSRVTARMCCAGGASSTKSALPTSAMSPVARIPGTSGTPCRKSGLTASRLMAATTSGSRAQSVTSWPVRRSTQAIAVPKAPPPRMPMVAMRDSCSAHYDRI